MHTNSEVHRHALARRRTQKHSHTDINMHGVTHGGPVYYPNGRDLVAIIFPRQSSAHALGNVQKALAGQGEQSGFTPKRHGDAAESDRHFTASGGMSLQYTVANKPRDGAGQSLGHVREPMMSERSGPDVSPSLVSSRSDDCCGAEPKLDTVKGTYRPGGLAHRGSQQQNMALAR